MDDDYGYRSQLRGSDYAELESVNSRAPSPMPGQKYESLREPEGAAGKVNPLEEDMTLGQAIRRFPKAFGYCMVMAIPIFGQGYANLVVPTMNSLGSFKEKFGIPDPQNEGKFLLPAVWLSIWGPAANIGAVLGAFGAGWLQDRIGRKYTIFVGTLISATSIAIDITSDMAADGQGRRVMYTVGTLLLGIAGGALHTACPVYVSEIAPTAMRGPIMGIFPFFVLLGQLAATGVFAGISASKVKDGYRIAFGSVWIFNVLTLIASLLIPMSPVHLLRRGKEEKAIRASTRLYAPKVSPYSAIELFRGVIDEERAQALKHPYLAAFKARDRRRTLICLFAGALPCLFGLDFLSSASYLLQLLGMEEFPSFITLMGGILTGAIAIAVGIWLMSRKGLRRLTITSLCITALVWLAAGITGFFQGPAAMYALVVAMFLVIGSCGIGVWPASFAYVAQVSSLKLRAVSAALAAVVAQVISIIMGIILPLLYNPDAANLGGKTTLVYFGTTTIAAGIAWLVLPEVKGRTIYEIDTMFAINLPTRQFRNYQAGDRQVDEDAVPLAQS